MAGEGSLAFVKGDGFESIPGTPTYYSPGRNPQVTELNLDRQLNRMREAGTLESVESLAGQLSGAFGITYGMSADTHEHVRDIVFNDSGTGFTTGRPAFSRWFVGYEHLTTGGSTGTVERELRGCIPLNYSIAYNVDQNTVTESLSMGYSTERLNTALTPSSITGPTDGQDVAFHGTDLNIDSTNVDRLQSMTLNFQGPLGQFHFENAFEAVDAQALPENATLQVDAFLTGTTQAEYAYGASAATAPTARMADVTATATFDVGGTTVAAYNLPKVKPQGYTWEEIFAAQGTLRDPITYNVDGSVSITTV